MRAWAKPVAVHRSVNRASAVAGTATIARPVDSLNNNVNASTPSRCETSSSESTGRAIVAVPATAEARFTDLCTATGFAHARIGVVDGEAGALDVQGHFTLPLDELRTVHTSTLPAIFASR